MPFPFRNLVFEGVGVRNVAYAGALMVLEEYGIFDQIERVAGTSSGSITATLVSLGYRPEEIRQHMLDLDFNLGQMPEPRRRGKHDINEYRVSNLKGQ